MIRLVCIIACLIFTAIINPVSGQMIMPHVTEQVDDPANPGSAGNDLQPDDDFAIALLCLACIAGIFILLCVGAGMILTFVVLFILFGLTTAGVLSVSILVGIHKRSFTSGFKTLLVTATTIGGLASGIIVFWIMNRISHWWSLMTTLTIGSVSGLLGGLLLGLLAFYTIKKLAAFFKVKLDAAS
jgi:MFS family permease